MVGGKLSHWLVFVVVVVIITANAASLVDNDIYDATTEWFKFKVNFISTSNNFKIIYFIKKFPIFPDWEILCQCKGGNKPKKFIYSNSE